MFDFKFRNGFWTWMALRRDGFPFPALMDKLIQYGHNFTAMAHFDDPSGNENPRRYSLDLANLIAHRVQRLNNFGIVPIVYYFNRHQEPWKDRDDPTAHWRTQLTSWSGWHEEWIDTVNAATDGMDMLVSPCLEPREEQGEWLIHFRDYYRSFTHAHETAYNSNHVYVAGFDHYEANTLGSPTVSFFNGDHNSRWLKEKNANDQVDLIESIDDDLGLLMVTEMELDGVQWGLPGWGNQAGLADWDNHISWEAMGKRSDSQSGNQPTPPDPPMPDYESKGRAYSDLLHYWNGKILKAKYAENPVENRENFERRIRQLENEYDD